MQVKAAVVPEYLKPIKNSSSQLCTTCISSSLSKLNLCCEHHLFTCCKLILSTRSSDLCWFLRWDRSFLLQSRKLLAFFDQHRALLQDHSNLVCRQRSLRPEHSIRLPTVTFLFNHRVQHLHLPLDLVTSTSPKLAHVTTRSFDKQTTPSKDTVRIKETCVERKQIPQIPIWTSAKAVRSCRRT